MQLKSVIVMIISCQNGTIVAAKLSNNQIFPDASLNFRKHSEHLFVCELIQHKLTEFFNKTFFFLYTVAIFQLERFLTLVQKTKALETIIMFDS